MDKQAANKKFFYVKFQSECFSLKAIKRAIYDLTNRINIEIDSRTDQETITKVIIDDSSLEKRNKLENKFKRAVQDHQLFIEVEEDYKNIRQLTVAQAFFPCDNLDEIVDKIKP